MPDVACTGCPGGCWACISSDFDRTLRECDRYREALADVIRVLDKYDNAPVTATNAIERARTVLAEDGGASA